MITIDEFVLFKHQHGKLTHYTRDIEAEWTEWKHEYGYPKEHHQLKFADGTIWPLPAKPDSDNPTTIKLRRILSLS